MKKEDEVAAPTSADEENCASGLIGSVLSLIISILVWLQETRCKNVGSNKNCTDPCDLAFALEKLSQFAKQTDHIGHNAAYAAECICPTHRSPLPVRDINSDKDPYNAKDDIEKNPGKGDRSKKGKKASKSLIREEQYSNQPPPKPENHPVYYAVDQRDPDCIRCCKKFVTPAPKPESANGNNKVLFEVVSAEMVENGTQTLFVELRDSFVQTDTTDVTEKEIEAIVSCICTSVQASHASIASRHPPETADKAVQVDDIEKVDTIQVRAMKGNESEPETEDEDCVCEVFADTSSPEPISPTDDEDDDTSYHRTSKTRTKKSRRNPRASKRAVQQESDYEGYETETTDYTEESDEEYHPNNSRRCLPSSKSKQGQQSPARESSYARSPPRQVPIRQERPPMYPTYEPAMYSSGYAPVYHDPYISQRYAYPPQPYYQKITRTIHRGGSPQNVRTAEYDVAPQGRTPRSSLGTDCTVECKGLQEKYSQYEAAQSSPKYMQMKASGNVYTIERELPVSDKTYTTTPRKLNSPRSTPPTTPKSSSPTTPPVSNMPPQPIVIKECDVRCSFVKTPNMPKGTYIPPPSQPLPQPEPVVDPNEEKKPPPKKCVARCSKRGHENKNENAKISSGPTVAYMPKQAIPISPKDVQSLEVVEAPTKKAVVADSFMSVEPSKKKK